MHTTESPASTPGSPAATSPIAQPCHDREKIVNVLTAAFTDDPVYSWAIPPTVPDRARHLCAYLRVKVDFALDHGGGAAVSADGTGVTLWCSPDFAPRGDELRAYYGRIAAATGPVGERCVQLAMMQSARPADLPRHVYSVGTGVIPGSQGRGTSLGLAVALAECCRDLGAGLYAVASSARAATLWIRYGAHQCGDTTLLPDGRTGGIPILVEPDRIEEVLGRLHDLAGQRTTAAS